MRIEGLKLVRQGDKKPSDMLTEMVLEESKKVKLTVPFKADGFKSEKQPTQPDGVTPVAVEPANIGTKNESKIEEPVKIEPKKQVKKTKKGGK
jgi:hypothetical protein